MRSNEERSDDYQPLSLSDVTFEHPAGGAPRCLHCERSEL